MNYSDTQHTFWFHDRFSSGIFRRTFFRQHFFVYSIFSSRNFSWGEYFSSRICSLAKKWQDEKMNEQRIARTKSWPCEKMPKRKNEDEKILYKKKRGTKNHATKECGTKICGRKNVQRKLAGRKSVLTRKCVCLGYFLLVRASELCVFKYLTKNNCYPQILSCLFPLEMMQMGYCS